LPLINATVWPVLSVTVSQYVAV